MPGNPVFNSLVEMVQLAPMFAEQVVARACGRANLEAGKLTEASVSELLPHLEASLKIFMSPESVQQRITAIRRSFKVAAS